MKQKMINFYIVMVLAAMQCAHSQVFNINCTLEYSYDYIYAKSLAVCDATEKLKIPLQYKKVHLVMKATQNKASTKLAGFRAVNKNLSFVPEFEDDVQTKIKVLTIKHSNLSEVSINNFKHLKELLVLDLSWNQIEYLERNLFAVNEKLTMIILDSNGIKLIDNKVFDDLNNLSYLDLSNNVCINENRTSQVEVKRILISISQECKDSILAAQIGTFEKNLQHKIEQKFSTHNAVTTIGFILTIFIIILLNFKKDLKIAQIFNYLIDKSSILSSRISKLLKLKNNESAHVNLNLNTERTTYNNTYEELPDNSTNLSQQTNLTASVNYSSNIEYEEIGYGCHNTNYSGTYSVNSIDDNEFYPEIQKPASAESIYQSERSEKVVYSSTYEK